MTCPDWQRFSADGLDEGAGPFGRKRGLEGDTEWQEAVEHIDGCSDCRREALAIDPLLLFRELPAANLSTDETDDLRRRVAVLRRTRAIETPRPGSRPRWVAAAVLLVAALGWTLGATVGEGDGVGAVEVQTAEVGDLEMPFEVPFDGHAEVSEAAALVVDRSLLDDLGNDHLALPLFEEIGEPYQQVVQWSDESMSVVLVVDARFDV